MLVANVIKKLLISENLKQNTINSSSISKLTNLDKRTFT